VRSGAFQIQADVLGGASLLQVGSQLLVRLEGAPLVAAVVGLRADRVGDQGARIQLVRVVELRGRLARGVDALHLGRHILGGDGRREEHGNRTQEGAHGAR